MKTLDIVDSMKVLKKYKVPTAGFVKVSSAGQLKQAAEKVGFPLVMKIVSEKHSHKTDVGGVAVGLKSPEEVAKAYSRLGKLSKEVLLQEQTSGTEVIIGVKRDRVFGPTIMFGMGGVFVEIYKDVSFRLCPVDKKAALGMIEETKASKILKGFRGKPAADIGKLAELIVKVSGLAVAEKGLVELDINPVMAGDNAIAVDARVVLG